MNWFRDIFNKCKLIATIAVVSTVGLLPVSGGFEGHEMITHPKTMTHDSATPAEVIGNRSLVFRSADNTVLNFNDSRCFEPRGVHSPAFGSITPTRMDGKS